MREPSDAPSDPSALRRYPVKRGGACAAAIAAHGLRGAWNVDHRRTCLARRRGLARGRIAHACCRHGRCERLAMGARIASHCRVGAAPRRRHTLGGKAGCPASNITGQRASPARRQRRLSCRRLCFSASASGARDSLPDRGRHSHRHPRLLDVLWSRRCLVRERPGCRVCAGGRRSPEPIHSGDDPAAGVAGKILVPVCQRRGQEQAAHPAIQNSGRCTDCATGAGERHQLSVSPWLYRFPGYWFCRWSRP